jgi:hypothetical protein
MEPLWDEIRIWWPGIVSSDSELGVAGSVERSVVVVIRGSKVIVVGKWPPREKVVRWRSRWPCSDFGSVTSRSATQSNLKTKSQGD